MKHAPIAPIAILAAGIIMVVLAVVTAIQPPSYPSVSSIITSARERAITVYRTGGGRGTGYKFGEGLALTAAHVLHSRAGETFVPQIDAFEKKVDGEIMWLNAEYDVALVRFVDRGMPRWRFPGLKLRANDLKIGETISISGFGLDLGLSTVSGEIMNQAKAEMTQDSPYSEPYTIWREAQAVQMTILPGHSGSGVVDGAGNYVGVAVGSLGTMNVGYIVPIQVLRRLMGR